MKTVNKEIKIVTLIVLMATVFLLAVGFVYAYFVTNTILTANTNFNDFGVSLYYTSNSISTEIAKTNGNAVNTLTLNPSSASISRGAVFGLNTQSSNAVDLVTVKTSNNSTPAYVRFWIEAYIVTNGVVDTSVDYAQYFTLGYRQTVSSVTSVVVTNDCYRLVYDMGDNDSSTNLVTYYVKNALAANSSADCFDAIQISQDAPSALLNKSIKITLSFEAVQASNNAYSAVFDLTTNPNYRGNSYWGII